MPQNIGPQGSRLLVDPSVGSVVFSMTHLEATGSPTKFIRDSHESHTEEGNFLECLHEIWDGFLGWLKAIFFGAAPLVENLKFPGADFKERILELKSQLSQSQEHEKLRIIFEMLNIEGVFDMPFFERELEESLQLLSEEIRDAIGRHFTKNQGRIRQEMTVRDSLTTLIVKFYSQSSDTQEMIKTLLKGYVEKNNRACV